jgi:hypothetical protein
MQLALHPHTVRDVDDFLGVEMITARLLPTLGASVRHSRQCTAAPVRYRGLPSSGGRRCEVSADHLPITSIWNECGIMGGRGPRIQAGAPGGGPPAGGAAPAPGAGAAGTGPYSAVMVRI